MHEILHDGTYVIQICLLPFWGCYTKAAPNGGKKRKFLAILVYQKAI